MNFTNFSSKWANLLVPFSMNSLQLPGEQDMPRNIFLQIDLANLEAIMKINTLKG